MLCSCIRRAVGSSVARRVRLSSSAAAPAVLPPVPAPPALPPQVPPTVSDVGSLTEALSGEPTFESIGLGGWSPSGLAQCFLEYLHVSFSLPWWAAIGVGTLCVRCIVFPAVLMSQRNNAHMQNNMPKMSYLQGKMSDAKMRGDRLETARYAQEMYSFMRDNKISPLKNALVPFAQFPFFVSFFIGLRGMAHCPVESLSTGGLFWFTDLTVPDQFYLLPVLTSLTMAATIELGVDSAKVATVGRTPIAKYVLRSIPVIMLPFTVNFPGAILCYWLSSNMVSLVQAFTLRIPKVRRFFKIPELVVHPVAAVPQNKKGFVNTVKDIFANMKISKEVEGRLRQDEISFNKAGKGPYVKTFKYDPTKVVPSGLKQS